MASHESEWNSVILDNEGHDFRLSLTIKNFLDYVCNPGEVLTTQQMECSLHCGAKWTLQVYLRGKTEERMDDIGVFLKLAARPAHAEIVTASYGFYVLGKSGRKFKHYTFNQKEDKLKIGCGTSRLIGRSDIKGNKDLYLPNGHFTIRCTGKAYFKKPIQTLKIEKHPHIVLSNPSPDVLKKMYEEGICCDVVLKSGSGEFNCHKSILSTTSNYFKAMFQHNMKENLESVVDVSKDLNEEELKALLDYIYLGTVEFPTLSETSFEALYRVADMYEINGLADVCEMSLINKTDSKNSKDLLLFAIQYGAKRLEKAAAIIVAKDSE